MIVILFVYIYFSSPKELKKHIVVCFLAYNLLLFALILHFVIQLTALQQFFIAILSFFVVVLINFHYFVYKKVINSFFFLVLLIELFIFAEIIVLLEMQLPVERIAVIVSIHSLFVIFLQAKVDSLFSSKLKSPSLMDLIQSNLQFVFCMIEIPFQLI